LFGFENWETLPNVRDLAKIFDTPAYIKWRAFRDTEDSRFTYLTMPRTLARLPYGANTKPIDDFAFEEVELGPKGESIKVDHDQYCWMNTAYVVGTRLTNAYSRTGFCTAIRGAENGGKVEGLPAHIFTSDEGDLDLKCPTEVGITDRRLAELDKLGFLPLAHYKNTDYSVFFGAQSTQKPKKYDRPQATENAAISARLPYMMACSRFAHFLKCIARDKLGSFMEREDCEAWLNRWIMNYVTADAKPSPSEKAKFPLADAKVEVKEIPGRPGAYDAVIHMRPWLQLEELNTSMRMVTRIPRQA
jgi:type VI secretion system protein ImpC